MQAELHPPILKEKEIAVAFNMGLQTAVYVQEKAEELSAEGRRFLIEELKQQIAESE